MWRLHRRPRVAPATPARPTTSPRVFGAMTAGVAASMPLGALLGGLAVEQVGLVPTLAACAVLYLVLGGSPLFIAAFGRLSSAREHGVSAMADAPDEASSAPNTANTEDPAGSPPIRG